jgi:hypothetical protein
MSLDDRLAREMRRQAGEVDGSGLPGADIVAAKARRRVRRRRLATGTAAVVLLVLGASVVFATTDDRKDQTDIRTEVPTTVSPPSTTIANATTTTPATPERARGTCSPPVLFTDMPDGWQNVVHEGAGGGSGATGAHVPGGEGRYIDILQGDGAFPAAGRSTFALPALGVDATIFAIHEGVAASIPVTTPCASSFQLAGYGISDADFRQVLLGLRPESECSANGLDEAAPESLAAPSGLPDAVRATANEVRRAAIACDFARLGELASSELLGDQDFVLGGDDEIVLGIALADRWRALEGGGEPVLRTLAGILTLEPYRDDYEGEPNVYTFPAYCEDRPLTDAEWASLEPIYGADRVAELRSANAQTDFLRDKYVGGQCASFSAVDGHWRGLFPVLP